MLMLKNWMSWLRGPFRGRIRGRELATLRRSFRPRLEPLEDRTLLSASPALRITINSTGASPLYFYSTSLSALDSFSIGGFSAVLQTASTNYPGGSTIGTLAQSLNLSSNSGGPFSIDSFAEVINSVTGLSTGPVTNSTDITSLKSAPLLPFTAPAGNPLSLSSDVSEDNNASFTSGSMVTVSTANTTTLNSLQVPLNGDATTNTNFANPNNQYTLQQDLRANNINGGVAGLDVISSTGVTNRNPSTPVDLAITKVDNKGGSSITPSTGTVVPGTSFVYTIVVSNNGPSNDVGSTISDPLSSVVGLTSDSRRGGRRRQQHHGGGHQRQRQHQHHRQRARRRHHQLHRHRQRQRCRHRHPEQYRDGDAALERDRHQT